MKRWVLVLVAVGAIAGLLTWKPARMAFVRTVGWNIDATTTTAAPPHPTGGTAAAVPMEAWRIPVGSHETVRLSEDDSYLVVEEDQGIRVYDALTGRERWHYFDKYMEVDEYGVFVGSSRTAVLLRDANGSPTVSTLIVFDLASGQRLATHEVSRDRDTTEYILLRNAVRAVRDDGSGAWEWRAACALGTEARNAQATVAAGRVVVAAECRHLPEAESRYVTLTALDPNSGREVWRRRLDDASLRGSPLFGTPRWGDTPLVLFGGDGDPTEVIAVDPATGRLLGQTPLGVYKTIAGVSLSPFPGGWCEAGYRSVRCVDAVTGRERWSYSMADRFGSAPEYMDVSVHGGRVAVVACDTDAPDPRCTAAVVDAANGSTISGPADLPSARIGGEGVISVSVLGYGPSGLTLRTGSLVKNEHSLESPGAVVTTYR